MKFNITTCLLLLVSNLVMAQPGIPYPSAAALREKVLYINNKVLNDFAGLKGAAVNGSEGLYEGTVHITAGDQPIAKDGTGGDFSDTYQVTFLVTPDNKGSEDTYKKWNDLFETAMTNYTKYISEIHPDHEVNVTHFFGPGERPMSVKVIRKKRNGMWAVSAEITQSKIYQNVDILKSRGFLKEEQESTTSKALREEASKTANNNQNWGKSVIDDLLHSVSAGGKDQGPDIAGTQSSAVKNSSDFCKEFQGVLKSSNNRLASLKKVKTRTTGGLDIYEPTIKLLPQAACFIYQSYLGSTYICEVVSANKASLQADFSKLEKEIQQCGVTTIKKTTREADDPELIQKTEFQITNTVLGETTNANRIHTVVLTMRNREKEFYMRLIID